MCPTLELDRMNGYPSANARNVVVSKSWQGGNAGGTLWGRRRPPHEQILSPASGSQCRRRVGGRLRAGIRFDGGAGSGAGAKCGRVYPLPDFPARVAGPVLCAGGVGGGAGDPVLSEAIPFQSLVSGGTADAAGAVSGRPDSIWQFGGSARREPVGGRRRSSRFRLANRTHWEWCDEAPRGGRTTADPSWDWARGPFRE